ASASNDLPQIAGPQPANKLSLKSAAGPPETSGYGRISAPDRDVHRRPEPGRRHAGGRRAHEVHGLGRTEEPAERAGRRAAVLSFKERGVPAGLDRQSRHFDQREFTAAQL